MSEKYYIIKGLRIFKLKYYYLFKKRHGLLNMPFLSNDVNILSKKSPEDQNHTKFSYFDQHIGLAINDKVQVANMYYHFVVAKLNERKNQKF